MSAGAFSLRTLLVLVTLVAVGCYALTQHTRLWCGIIMTLACSSLALAVLLAIAARGPWRAFWTGYAVVGCAYWLLTVSPFVSPNGGVLLTTQSLAYGWHYLSLESKEISNRGEEISEFDLSEWTVDEALETAIDEVEAEYFQILWSPRSGQYSLRRYLLIGQSLYSIGLGFVGALLSGWLYARRMRRDAATKAIA